MPGGMLVPGDVQLLHLFALGISFGPGDLLLVRGNLQLAFKSGDQGTISPARGNCEMIFIETPNTVICGPLLMAARRQVFFLIFSIASVYAGFYAGFVLAERVGFETIVQRSYM
jgi:hypothetical protein